MDVVAMESVRRGNVSANRDSAGQTAVSVHKELSVIRVKGLQYLDLVALEVGLLDYGKKIQLKNQ